PEILNALCGARVNRALLSGRRVLKPISFTSLALRPSSWEAQDPWRSSVFWQSAEESRALRRTPEPSAGGRAAEGADGPEAQGADAGSHTRPKIPAQRRGGGCTPRLAVWLLDRQLLFQFDQRSFRVFRIDFPDLDRAPAGFE